MTWYVGLVPTAGLFVDSGQSLATAQDRFCSVGDLDGDGDPDVFIIGGSPVWFNE